MRLLQKLSGALALWLLCSTLANADVFVRGYYRSDGTRVRSHYRSNPDGNFWNNWSTFPNVNPYTGQVGTKFYPPPTQFFAPPAFPDPVPRLFFPPAFRDLGPAVETPKRAEPRERKQAERKPAFPRPKVNPDYVPPTDEERAESKLKVAELLLSQGDKEAVDYYCRYIIRTFPNTKAAEKAKRLQESLKPAPLPLE